jgi:hypothetical protein
MPLSPQRSSWNSWRKPINSGEHHDDVGVESLGPNDLSGHRLVTAYCFNGHEAPTECRPALVSCRPWCRKSHYRADARAHRLQVGLLKA